MPSASMSNAPTTLQNSSNVCQSRPLRARRDASMLSTAPTSPSHSKPSNRSKPGRSVPEPERPRSSSMTSTRSHPSCRARSTSAYCRRWLSRLLCTWSGVDWRTYTHARRDRCSAVILFIAFSLVDRHGDDSHPLHHLLQQMDLNVLRQLWQRLLFGVVEQHCLGHWAWRHRALL